MNNIPLTNGNQLRALTESDLDSIIAQSLEQEVARFYWSTPKSKTDIEEFWKIQLEYEKKFPSPHQMQQEYTFVIEAQGKPAGAVIVNISPRVFSQANKKGHLARIPYFVGKEFRGIGLGAQAIYALQPFIFDTLDSEILLAECHKHNYAARSTLIKANLMKYEPRTKFTQTDGTQVMPTLNVTSDMHLLYMLTNRTFQALAKPRFRP